MLTGIHTIAPQAAGDYVEIAYRIVLSAPVGNTQANKRSMGAIGVVKRE